MEFRNCIRNAYGKCDVPANTIDRIKAGFRRLNLQPEYAHFKVSDDIHWGRVWIDSIKIVCNGKGITPQLAEASAYAELAERFSAGLFYPVFEERVRFNIPALYNQQTNRFLNGAWLQGYVRAHQDHVQNPLRIEDLLANEAHLQESHFEDIKNSPMAGHWVNGYSMLHCETVKVPINFVTYIHASNGIAAGNTMEEAIVQAACEIFERHAQIQTIKPERIAPSIDPDSVDNAVIQDLIAFYGRQNVRVMIKDLSLNGLLPAIGVLFINHNLRSDRLEHRILIPGASFDTDEGLTRCFTESMQGRETLLASRPQLDKPVVHRSQVDHFYLLMKCGISPKDIAFLEQGRKTTYRPNKINDMLSEIEKIKEICRRFDTDCILIDYTHPILDFPVVRVVIPRISDFLPFLKQDILISEATRPAATWRGEEFTSVMNSFFA